MPVKGSGCGIRPNIEEMEDSEGFDFSAASELLQKNTEAEDPETDTQTPERKKEESKVSDKDGNTPKE